MSVKVAAEGTAVNISGQAKDSFGLPVQDGLTPRKDTADQATVQPTKNQSYGVRVPVLKDFDGRYVKLKNSPCRFDIVERVTTVIKPGSYGSVELQAAGTMKLSPGRDSNENPGSKLSRHHTFHSTVEAREAREASVLDRIGPYHWNKWVKPARESDARDRLYKNTYCLDPDFLRYRSLTLPRISNNGTEERPWTVGGGDDIQKGVVKSEQGEYSKVVTMVPQQPRGTVVKFREYMKPCTYSADNRPFEVKRVSSRQNQNNHFTTVKGVFPLIRHDFRRSPKRQERPLKFENARYIKGNKGTLFTKHVLPIYKNAFDRDYSSADTFKEYLESLQHVAKPGTPGMHSKAMTGYRFYNEPKQNPDYHNQVLQSVSDVNHPSHRSNDVRQSQDESSGDHDPMKIEIKSFMKESVQKAPTIDNLSSVQGSLVQGRSDSQSHLPISSSVVGGKGGTKPNNPVLTKEDTSPVDLDNKADGKEAGGSVVSATLRRTEPVIIPDPNDKPTEEVDLPCPANTPTPPDNEQTEN